MTATINEMSSIAITTIEPSLFSMIASADIVSKIVILILVIASIWSWTVIFDKIALLSKTKKKIARFESIFWSGQILDQLYENVKNAIDNPLAGIFVSAMNECKRSIKRNSSDGSLKIGQKERVLQSMRLVCDREFEKLEKNLVLLATVGSSATFVGLFGTVWGIMHSFQSIAASKNTTLAVVAPGIAEALLATAIGLIAAIPAAIFHNYLLNQVMLINNKMEDFVGELQTLLSRAIDEERI